MSPIDLSNIVSEVEARRITKANIKRTVLDIVGFYTVMFLIFAAFILLAMIKETPEAPVAANTSVQEVAR